ncbi:MAG TPA: hypothetical protein PLR65_12620, partial [Anaerolineales bacterium]|nr:hypothetical protein [Anaerolineales bacterium]
KTKPILGKRCDTVEQVETLVARAREISDALQKLPPTISEDEVRVQLNAIAEKALSWSKGDDRQIRSTLSHINGALNGMRALKDGGVFGLPNEIAVPLKQLMEDLKDVGLFLVPVGELECWLSNSAIQASKKIKWAWANEAAEFLRTNDEQDGDIWSFMRTIGDYLTAQFR